LNNRRKLLIALGAGAVAAPLASFAQPPGKVWRVGFLQTRGRPASIEADFIGGFVQGMRDRGYTEGKNLVIEWRFADGDVTRLPGIATELVQLKLDALVGFGPQPVKALKQATDTIPIVMAAPGDPVIEGFVQSLARPGGNLTGATSIAGNLNAKRLQMLQEIAPGLSRVAFVLNPANPSHGLWLSELQATVQKSKVKIIPAEARSVQEIEAAFDVIKREKAQAIIVQTDGIFNGRTEQFAEFSLKQRLPLISGIREYAQAGSLMSYGATFYDILYRCAYFVDRIFKGAKPADLPVEQPTKFELVINGKTAKILGLKIPQSLLISADKVIE
jgi:putative tryptophan/tyrosine transport system substrate-binding protein